ncbi:MAG TPA: 23S rRNA (adenine(2503)-C(2))-methyltransferase RlmN [Fimbriiglobus sp.]|jgi:23S rRNA (adenine2503-C2)-methyltransferase
MPVASLPIAPTADPRQSVLAEPPDALKAWLTARAEPAMRARQIRRWVHVGRAESFDQMTDLPKGLRTALAAEFEVFSTRVVTHQVATDGTHKLLLKLADGKLIECVLIQDAGRATACVSTQVGCGMGCVFCASGLNGVARNLTAGEIVEQLVRLRNLIPGDGRLTHVVVMGMGEPLANLDHLLAALAVAGDKNGLGIGARHVTISTVGLPVKIRQLAAAGKQYHLAVSLHAPNDILRTEIVPTNDKTGMTAILAAADHFYETTGRRVTYEYVVLGGLNDRPEHGRELASRLRNRHALVNLIPWNEVSGLPYRRPNEADLNAFMAELESAGVRVKVRKRKGSEIDAACGQLRRTVNADLQGVGPVSS